MTVADMCTWMEHFAPLERACDWDHVGLMVGDRHEAVTGVLTCLDATMAVLEEAVAEGRNMVISHHPFIFHPLAEIDYASPRGRLVRYAVQHDLAIYSAHTNLDYAERGVNWALACRLGLSSVHWDVAHCHLVGVLPGEDLLARIGSALETSLQVVGDFDGHGDVVVGISSGAFDGETQWCLAEGVQVLVTGEVKHSDALDLGTMPFVTVSAGHYATERWIAGDLARELGKMAKASGAEQAPLKAI